MWKVDSPRTLDVENVTLASEHGQFYNDLYLSIAIKISIEHRLCEITHNYLRYALFIPCMHHFLADAYEASPQRSYINIIKCLAQFLYVK